MFIVDDAIIAALTSLGNDGSGHATALSSSGDCSYYSCDHSADYVGTGSDGVTNLTKDGVIYPDYKPFGAVPEPHHGPTMLSEPPGCSGYACDNSADYIGSDGNLLTDGVIYPAQTKSLPLPMLDSTDCSYYSCDHSADYVGSSSDGVSNLTKDGLIYPEYKPFGAVAEPQHGPTMLSEPTGCSGYACDNSADYIGSDGNLLTDGVIYPAQTKSLPLPMLDSTDCSYYSCDHSADYIGTNSDGVNNLTEPGTIYPGFKYGVWGANAEHATGVKPTMLADGSHSLPADHSGAFYCTEPEANCSTTVADPPTPAITLASQGTTSLYSGADASGAYYCSDPVANCSTTVVDPVLKPIVYPEGVSAALAAPVAAPEMAKVAAAKKPSRPSPGHLDVSSESGTRLGEQLLMGHACVFGAIDATAKALFGKGEDDKTWTETFVASSTAAAGAVTPVGAFILRERVLKA